MIYLTVRDKQKRHTEHLLVIIATTANISLGMVEVAIRTITPTAVANYTQAGSIIFIFINTIALAIYFRRTEAELALANDRRRQDELQWERMTAENAALDALSRSKTEFLATISHEMKTPLTIIGGFTQLAIEQLETGMASAKTFERLNTVAHESLRLAEFVNKLLADTATASGHKFDGYVAADMCATFLEPNKNRIKITVEENCPPVKANAGMILQVFFNLLGNATRQVKNDTIEISAKREGEMVMFTVQDNGKGIPPELADKIFARGVSGDGGTGLGLHVCKETVEAHGGTIALADTNGRGTSISFTLPVYNEGGTP